MRIGELAALVGVSTRAVRHYHHIGLLPDPVRRVNGYREYTLRDAVVLARVRRLAELGLSLDEIRDVLAADHGRELREVLRELDADLARQQAAIEARRARLATLLDRDDLDVDATVSPDLAAVLRDLPVSDSPTAAFDRDVLTMLDTAPEGAHLVAMLRPLAQLDVTSVYARLDALAAAEPDDPRITALADDLAAQLPAGVIAMMAEGGDWPGALAPDLSPAQVEVFRQLRSRA